MSTGKVMTPYRRLKEWARRVANTQACHVATYPLSDGSIGLAGLQNMARVAAACNHYLVVTPNFGGSGVCLYTVRKPEELPVRLRRER